jgi:hypothetical protein
MMETIYSMCLQIRIRSLQRQSFGIYSLRSYEPYQKVEILMMGKTADENYKSNCLKTNKVFKLFTGY